MEPEPTNLPKRIQKSDFAVHFPRRVGLLQRTWPVGDEESGKRGRGEPGRPGKPETGQKERVAIRTKTGVEEEAAPKESECGRRLFESGKELAPVDEEQKEDGKGENNETTKEQKKEDETERMGPGGAPKAEAGDEAGKGIETKGAGQNGSGRVSGLRQQKHQKKKKGK